MKSSRNKELKEIIGGMKCPKDFKCYRSGFKNLCKAKDIGIESHLECLEDDPYECNFSISFGYSFVCRCPLRVYIAKEIEK